MAEHSTIEWTDATWNPITGCSVVSPGCTNCYAMRLAGTRLRNHPSRAGLTQDSKAGPVWTGEVRLNEDWLDQPLRWKRPRMIFVCAHGDLFHESVPDEWIDKVFAVMALAHWHTFQVLTKRAARMRAYMTAPGHAARVWDCANVLSCQREKPPGIPISRTVPPDDDVASLVLPNVWLGISAEDQRRADERLPDLRATPAAVRWVSAEPLLGPIDADLTDLHWVVAGGESGPGARPMHQDWARSLRDQCGAAGVPFHFKQWGEFTTVYDRDRDDPDWRRCDTAKNTTPNGRWLNLAGGHGFHGERVVRVDRLGKSRAGRLLDGVEHNGMPG